MEYRTAKKKQKKQQQINKSKKSKKLNKIWRSLATIQHHLKTEILSNYRYF